MTEGILIQNGVHLQKHEYETIQLLLKNGYNIELIPPSQIKDFHTPDIIMNGLPWEIKSPQGDGKKTVQNIIQKAAQQSGNVIIDLRRIKMPEEKAISSFKQQFRLSKSLKRMKLITKTSDIIDISK